MLLNSPEFNIIEQNYVSLFGRTLKKGCKGKSGPELKSAVKKHFKSFTFKKQLDSIINSLYVYSIETTDQEIKGALKASSFRKPSDRFLGASEEDDQDYLILTEEAVSASQELSEAIMESVIRTLKDEAIYTDHPFEIAKRILDLWGGEKYRAVRFARTFNAEIATNTALFRFQDQGIEECQFSALIDSKTSPQCRILHGTVFRVDSPEARLYRPPLHHHCRSSMIPLPYSKDAPDSLRFDNRDFSKPVSQGFKPDKIEYDQDIVKQTFKEIKGFREDYGIPQYILDKDIELRLAKLNIQVSTPSK